MDRKQRRPGLDGALGHLDCKSHVGKGTTALEKAGNIPTKSCSADVTYRVGDVMLKGLSAPAEPEDPV